jgi:bifunctional non-homologous end joining protein LigD
MGLRVLQPMLASLQPPTEPAEWALEPKLDGWRALVYVDGVVTVRTRTGRDVTANLPHLQELAELGRRVVLDGELVADAARTHPFYRLGGR